MTPLPHRPPARRLTATLFAALLVVAACGVPAGSSAPTSTPGPTDAPPAPSFSLGPTPSGCPTAAPSPMAAGQTATVTLNTNFGAIVVKVKADLGPNAAGAFMALAGCGYYNNVIFHRIVSGFVIQAGDGSYARLPSLDPNKVGQGGPGFSIKDDKVTAKYTRGMVAMGRTSTADSGGSQFFIVLDDSAQTALGDTSANNYAQFGEVTSGMDVVDKIALIPTGGTAVAPETQGDLPLQPAVIESVTITTP